MVAIACPFPGIARRPACSPRVRRRRRRLAAAVVTAVAAIVVWTLVGVAGWPGSGPLAAPGSVPARLAPAAAVVYIVQPGDTVWSIARSFQPRGEVRPLVDRLQAQVGGRSLQVGDRIVLP